MEYLVPEVAFVAATLASGYLVFYGARIRIGWFGVAAYAVPVGLLAWPLAASVASATGLRFGHVTMLVGVGVLLAITRVAAGKRGTGSLSNCVGMTRVAVSGMLTLAAATLLALLRLSTTSSDAYRLGYWPQGVWLTINGSFETYLVSSRSMLIPGMNAAHVVLGSDWAYVIYPLLAMNLLFVLGALLVSGPLRELSARARYSITAAFIVFLLADPTFLYHAFYVHSHMISAVYLLLSLAALWWASESAESDTGSSTAWLTVGGLMAAGLALTRVDGLAYVFVPVAFALAVLTDRNLRSRKATIAFFAPLLAVVYASYAGAFIPLGLWSARKLDGLTALVILIALGAAAVVPSLAHIVERRTGRAMGGDRLLVLFTLAGLCAMALAALLRWKTMRLAAIHAGLNLFGGEGAWGPMWFLLASLLILTLLTGDAWRSDLPSRSLFMVVVLFFIIASLVHGTSHAGRLGANDSFNRVAFHIVPVVLWYLACVAGRILAVRRPDPGHGVGDARLVKRAPA